MNFIKSIWNKVKFFFGGLFVAKKVIETKAAIVATKEAFGEYQAEVVKTEQVEVAAIAAVAEAKEETAKLNRCAEIYQRVAATSRNHSLVEADAAFDAGDEATLLRIERQLKAGTYKAPSVKSAKKEAKLRKPSPKFAAA